MPKHSTFMAAGALSASLLLAVPGVAAAHPRPAPTRCKSSALAAPFNLSIKGDRVLVADGGMEIVGKLKKDGTINTIAADQPGTSGVAMSGKHLAFTTTVTNTETFENTAAGLNIWATAWQAGVRRHLRLRDQEEPGQGQHYGVVGQPAASRQGVHRRRLEADAFRSAATYTGHVDSHAYSVAAMHGGWVVADAGANALWLVDNGAHQTLAVLPPQPFTFDAAVSRPWELPTASSASPTRSSRSRPMSRWAGTASFTSRRCPAAPRSPALGARGKVYRVNPWTGRGQGGRVRVPRRDQPGPRQQGLDLRRRTVRWSHHQGEERPQVDFRHPARRGGRGDRTGRQRVGRHPGK